MIINKAYKVEIDPNNKQKTLLEKSVGVSRFVYNWGLNQRIELYKNEKKSTTAFTQSKDLNAIKKEQFPWLKEVSSWVSQSSLRNLDAAFNNFFRDLKKGKKVGFPKFKSKKNDKQSFNFYDYFIIKNNKILIPRIGKVRLKEKNYIPTSGIKVNFVTVLKDVDRWCVSVNVEEEIPDPPKEETVLGVDVGIKTLATCSNGVTYENPKFLKKMKKRLALAQRNHSRKKNGSKNKEKSKLKLQKLYRKVRNQRKDNINKMTTDLVKTKPRVIVLEDLNVAGMVKNHKLANAIFDASFYEIKRQLMYKTSWYGGSVIEVDRFFPSSKMCSVCEVIKDDLILNDRIYTCSCGNELDRDLNAAINLEKYGLNELQNTAGSAEIKVCGESVSLLEALIDQEAVSMKQKENGKVKFI